VTAPNSPSNRPRILDLPCGGTIAADLIAGVRVLPAVPADIVEGWQRRPGHPERVELLVRRDSETRSGIVYPEDPQAVGLLGLAAYTFGFIGWEQLYAALGLGALWRIEAAIA
jgi:hypothetical protein